MFQDVYKCLVNDLQYNLYTYKWGILELYNFLGHPSSVFFVERNQGSESSEIY